MQPVTERHVQAIWYDDNLRPKHLTTRRGNEVHVIHPGTWNLGAGPDFCDAVLEIGKDRRRVVGDVEIHLLPIDWERHGHGNDQLYQHVIAHVTWGCGPVPPTLPTNAVSIWLGKFVLGNPSFDAGNIDLEAYPYARQSLGGRPCEERLGRNCDEADGVLTAAGRHRIDLKARRIGVRLCQYANRGERQIFYEETMRALGYRHNADAFRRLAERIPLDSLPSETDAARNALLVAGSFETWNRRGMRPNNSPERRLESAARLFRDTSALSLVNATDFSRAACVGMISAFSRGSGIGRGRLSAIIANVFVPFAIGSGRIARAPDWLPPEDVSDKVRLAAFRLFGSDHNPLALYADNGLKIQGVLQIYEDLCLNFHPDCRFCPLGVRGAPALPRDGCAARPPYRVMGARRDA